MKKLNVKLNNCYGIKNLEYEFDFEKNKNYILYASNGMMKTSFTKTFKQLALNKKPTDEVFKRETICDVKIDGKDIEAKDIFVISSYEDEYISPNSGKLMVHKSLRDKYDEAVLRLKEKENILYDAISKIVLGEKSPNMLLADFLECSSINVIEELKQLFDNGILNEEQYKIDFKISDYESIFNETVKNFIKVPNNLKKIEKYSEIYDDLLKKSTIFKRGVFSHNNATNVFQSLLTNKFFNASHKIKLNGIEKEISSQEELDEIIAYEKNKIWADKKLEDSFNKINKALSKKQFSKLRDAIEADHDIIVQLANYESFERKVWVNILSQVQVELENTFLEYDECQLTIKQVKEAAKKEETKWDKVLKVFKSRFTAPFKIEVPNKEEVAFSDKIPEFIFKYVDSDTEEEKIIERKDLEKVLSQGEKRALFLLNIINDLEALKELNGNHLIIVDDVAESFDYKNKYAIIEYLSEMSLHDNLNFIILTHNFDFYRTISKRCKENLFPQMVQRKKNGIEIVMPKYVFKNPFELMKKGMINNNDNDIITSIPFVRNLIEYTEGSCCENYLKLTSLLHMKKNTKNITIKELQDIFNCELKSSEKLTFALGRENQSVYSLIIDEARKISQEDREGIDLSGKIIISMAIRLIAEEYMIREITNNGKEPLKEINGMQTGVLVGLYREKFKDRETPLEILNKVLLMSSENIHINSFMFEPLIDMSIKSLISLYAEVSIWKIN